MNVYYTCPRCGEKKADAFGVCDCTTPEEKEKIIREMILVPLDGETDLDLLLEFRQRYWDTWVSFCEDRGYKPVIS